MRPLLTSLLAMSVLGSATAKTPMTLVYEGSIAGIGAAEFYVTVQIESLSYRVDTYGKTYGAAALLGSLIVNANSVGTLTNGTVTPSAFGTDNVYKGDARRSRVTWVASEAVAQEVFPSLMDEERTPIPDDARGGALDPIAALMGFSIGGPARGTCSGVAKVFDGRRSYTLTLDSNDAGQLEGLDIGGVNVTALKCRIGSLRTGGKSPDGWLSSSSDMEYAEIWFQQDGSGRALPLRVEADAPIGYAVVQLEKLP